MAVTVMAGACDSAPAQPNYAELYKLPSVAPDAWLTTGLNGHSSISADLGHLKGSARLPAGQVAIFSSSAGDCGFAYRSSDGVVGAFSGVAPSDAGHAAGAAHGIDSVQLVNEVMYPWGRAERLADTAEPLPGQSGAPVSVETFCGDHYAALVVPRSFAGGAPGAAHVQGATSERALGDGRSLIVVGDDKIRDRLGASLDWLASARPTQG